ncbi:hypothetical protein NET03_09620 [Thermomicrobium sp. CFH 73360]|uniref:hypothetical protein n=1 Tax=Thermomicrobium sp. CFH 73360 TaxID=2951987 RepID=UPI0020774F99|nr:hypothetical protein [Thermomicrobium sp. CFH 73360]MCM8746782.1 hypothetical protein [Thermomicrobium sp. CFH 73360]
MPDTRTPPATWPEAPRAHVVVLQSTPSGHDIAEPVLQANSPGYDPTTTRRPVGATRDCPHCGSVVPVPLAADPDDPAAPGDRCPSCGYDWPGGAP